ncbi:TPA: hypothetical protein ACW0I5_002701 [Escherichia coli]
MSKRTEDVIFKLEEIAKAESELVIEGVKEGFMGLTVHSALLAAVATEAVAVIKQLDRDIKLLKTENASETALTLNDCIDRLVHTAHSTYPDAVLKIVKRETCIVAPVVSGLLVELPKEHVFITK